MTCCIVFSNSFICENPPSPYDNFKEVSRGPVPYRESQGLGVRQYISMPCFMSVIGK